MSKPRTTASASRPKGIRKTPTSWQVFAKVDGRFRSKRFPLDTPLATLEKERRKLLDAPEPREAGDGFTADADAYLALVGHLASYDDRAYEIQQWALAFGERDRDTITSRDIRAVLETWRVSGRADGTGGLSVASLNRRRTALMSLYRTLDGKSAANPVKDIPEYDESENEQIRAHDPRLLYRLIARVGRKKWGRPPSKTRARLRLMLWTGWPQKQIMRLTPEDIDWKTETVWIAGRKKGKGTKGRRLPLFPGAVVALRAFVAADAWGDFSTSAMHSALARACVEENRRRARLKLRPVRVYPYMLRHSFCTELAKIITDERALQDLMLHGTSAQTRRYSVGADQVRMQTAIAHALRNAARP